MFLLFLLNRREHSNELWETLGKILPHWKLENSITVEEAKELNAPPTKKKDEKDKKSREKLERGVIASQTTSDRSSERESKLREKDSKEKFLSNAASHIAMKDVIKEPEFAVFASYSNPPKTPLRVSVLREMASVMVLYFCQAVKAIKPLFSCGRKRVPSIVKIDDTFTTLWKLGITKELTLRYSSNRLMLQRNFVNLASLTITLTQ